MRITGFSHASINIHEAIDETMRFYEDFLGLASKPRPESLRIPGAWYRAGDAEIHVIGAEHDGRAGNPIGPHTALLVADLDEAISEIEAAGLKYLSAGHGMQRQVWITDPAGNTIELQQDPELQAKA